MRLWRWKNIFEFIQEHNTDGSTMVGKERRQGLKRRWRKGKPWKK